MAQVAESQYEVVTKILNRRIAVLSTLSILSCLIFFAIDIILVTSNEINMSNLLGDSPWLNGIAYFILSVMVSILPPTMTIWYFFKSHRSVGVSPRKDQRLLHKSEIEGLYLQEMLDNTRSPSMLGASKHTVTSRRKSSDLTVESNDIRFSEIMYRGKNFKLEGNQIRDHSE